MPLAHRSIDIESSARRIIDRVKYLVSIDIKSLTGYMQCVVGCRSSIEIESSPRILISLQVLNINTHAAFSTFKFPVRG